MTEPRAHIVEVHLDPNQPGAPFVGIYEPGEDGTPCRRLRLPSANTGAVPTAVQAPALAA